MSGFQAGDTVYSLQYGVGEVLTVEGWGFDCVGRVLPVVVRFTGGAMRRFTADGCLQHGCIDPQFDIRPAPYIPYSQGATP